MNKGNRTFNKHLAAITSGKVTKTNIIGMRKALNHDVRRGNGWSTVTAEGKRVVHHEVMWCVSERAAWWTINAYNATMRSPTLAALPHYAYWIEKVTHE